MNSIYIISSKGVGGSIFNITAITSIIAAIYAFRKKIPHPTEFWLIGIWFTLFRIHKHPPLNIIIDFQTARNLKKSKSYYIKIISGRFTEYTNTETVENNSGILEFYQRVNIHVRQKDNSFTLELHKKSLLTSELIGEAVIDVLSLINYDYPKDMQVDFKKNNYRTATCNISFFEDKELPIELYDTKLNNPGIIQQLVIQSQLNGCELDPKALLVMDHDTKLALFCTLLEGELYLMNISNGSGRFIKYYFKATLTTSKEWVWCYWADKGALKAKEDPIGSIFIASITAILKNDVDKKRHEFLLRYMTKNGNYEIYLKRVDRDRNLWVDSLYIVIELLHEKSIYTNIANKDNLQQQVSKIDKSNGHAKIINGSKEESKEEKIRLMQIHKPVSEKDDNNNLSYALNHANGNNSDIIKVFNSNATIDELLLHDANQSNHSFTNKKNDNTSQNEEANFNNNLFDLQAAYSNESNDDIFWIHDPDELKKKISEEVKKQNSLLQLQESYLVSASKEELTNITNSVYSHLNSNTIIPNYKDDNIIKNL